MPEVPDYFIEVTGFDPLVFIREVYNLSKPLGMGYLHYRPGDCPEMLPESIWNQRQHFDYDGIHPVVHLDYVYGRCCKMPIYKLAKEERYFVRKQWMDHSPEDYKELFRRCDLDPELIEDYPFHEIDDEVARKAGFI